MSADKNRSIFSRQMEAILFTYSVNGKTEEQLAESFKP